MFTGNLVENVGVARLISTQSDPPLLENWITKTQLAQLLGLSVSFINKLMAEDGLPHLKAGRAVRFRYSEVMAWFQRKGMKP